MAAKREPDLHPRARHRCGGDVLVKNCALNAHFDGKNECIIECK
jgi:hypothetical protein